jgi:amino acid transporter
MATQSIPAPVTKPADVGLKREVGLIGAIWASETSIIGSGWLFGSYFAAQAVGSAALICWIIAGIAVIILALVHAELGGMFPVAGGTARFPHLAFGSVAGVSFGFFSWLQAVAVAPIECFAVMQYGSHYWHGLYNSATSNVTGLGFGMTVVLMAIFTAINFLAIKYFARVNNIITWWKVAIPCLAIIVLLFKFHGANFSSGGGFIPKTVTWKDIFAAIPGAGIVFAYLGFEQADQLAGEVKDPQKNLPRAIIIAIGLGTAIYVLLQVVFIAAMDPVLLKKTGGFLGITCPPSPAHCAPSISNIVSGPFAGVATAALLGWLATILYIDAFISPFGTGLMYETSTSRVGYGLARNRYFPPWFQRTDANGVPWISLILAFLFGLVFLLPFPSWHSLVGLITSASVLMYAGAPLALGAFRKQVPEVERPYRMPGAVWLGPAAFIIANLIIYWSGFEVIWKLGICLVIGYVVIGFWMAQDPERPKLNWRAAQWLPVYLIGMGIISWQGQFSGAAATPAPKPPTNTGNIPFWWDILVVAVFSLIVYYWAQAVRLPREEMLGLVEKQSGTAPDPRVH